MIGFAFQAVGRFEVGLLDLMTSSHQSRVHGFDCRGTLKAHPM